jgi:hypothetical protein
MNLFMTRCLFDLWFDHVRAGYLFLSIVNGSAAI